MPYVVKMLVPGVSRPMYSAPMSLPEAEAAERVLKRKHGVGVALVHVPPATRSRQSVEEWIERVAARRAS